MFLFQCHTGILGGGHYVAYGVNPNNKWYCFNDSSVKVRKTQNQGYLMAVAAILPLYMDGEVLCLQIFSLLSQPSNFFQRVLRLLLGNGHHTHSYA